MLGNLILDLSFLTRQLSCVRAGRLTVHAEYNFDLVQ
jgi:hypothetical protein